MFEAILDGWRAQQTARYLKPKTIQHNERGVRAFVGHVGRIPREWRVSDVDEYFEDLLSRPQRLARSPLRAYRPPVATCSRWGREQPCYHAGDPQRAICLGCASRRTTIVTCLDCGKPRAAHRRVEGGAICAAPDRRRGNTIGVCRVRSSCRSCPPRSIPTRRRRPHDGWLLPGRKRGTHITAEHLRKRLAPHGITSRPSRHGAPPALAGRLPAPILAERLGIHQARVAQWARGPFRRQHPLGVVVNRPSVWPDR